MRNVTMGNQQRSLENDLHWLGGIIDGEGAIMAIKRSEKHRTNSYVPKITIVNTNPIIIRDCLSILETVGLPHYVQTKEGKGTWKTKIEIIIAGYKRVSKVLPILLPFIRSKKNQALKLLELVNSRLEKQANGRGIHAPYSDYEIKLTKEIKQLNKGSLILPETIRQEQRLTSEIWKVMESRQLEAVKI